MKVNRCNIMRVQRIETFFRPGFPLILVWVIVLTFFDVARAGADDVYFPYVYTRAVYLESPGIPGAWWTNPALPAFIDSRTFFSTNVLPLGDRFLMSSVRGFLPLEQGPVIGAGIMGTGLYESGSQTTKVKEDKVEYISEFAFTRPRFQLGAAMDFGPFGAAGVLGTVGSEARKIGITSGRRDSFEQNDKLETVLSPGFGFGWFSPSILRSLRLSAATMFIYHPLNRKFWESGGKLGFALSAFDSALCADGQYGFSYKEGLGVYNPDNSGYHALKTIVSVRLYDSMRAFAGYSTATEWDYSNPQFAHLGVEMTQSNLSPFWGGYEISVKPGRSWAVLHRAWLALTFGDKG